MLEDVHQNALFFWVKKQRSEFFEKAVIFSCDQVKIIAVDKSYKQRKAMILEIFLIRNRKN